MTLVQVVGPTVFPVTLTQAKAHLRVSHDHESALIEALIKAAVARAEGETGQPFSAQTWELVLDAFPAGEIVVPIGPVNADVEIFYTPADGPEVEIDGATFLVDSVARSARIFPVSTWPTAADVPNAVRVRVAVGGTCPEDVRTAILMMVATWYAHREDVLTGAAVQELPLASRMILSLHRRMFV